MSEIKQFLIRSQSQIFTIDVAVISPTKLVAVIIPEKVALPLFETVVLFLRTS